MPTFKPRESRDVLINPGIGWCTMCSFNDDPWNRGTPRASIAYFRMFWDELEPEEGNVRFDAIDHWLERCRQNGQTLELGFKPAGWYETEVVYRGDDRMPPLVSGLPKPYRVPQWYFDLKPRGRWFRRRNTPEDSPLCWEADYDDPLYLEKHGNLLRAIGKRYDGHPLLTRVDIGSIGAWGEWNCYGVPHPTWETRKALIDIYFEAFPKTIKTIVLGDAEALRYVLSRGGGWAAHSLGDMRDEVREAEDLSGRKLRRVYNHMEDIYAQRIVEVGGMRAWRQAPVMFESSNTIADWHRRGWGADYIFSFALGMHASIMHDKSSPIPDEWWPAVEEFSRKLGYRFVLREVSVPDRPRAGESMTMSLRWENRGVAPCYLPHRVAVRFTHESTGRQFIATDDADIRRWLPGIHQHTIDVALPGDFPAGPTRCDVAMVSMHDSTPAIALAIEGQPSDRWYTLGGVVVDPFSR